MVKINGYWLGLGLISLIDYTWLVFNSAIYNNAISTITGIFVIVSFGLALLIFLGINILSKSIISAGNQLVKKMVSKRMVTKNNMNKPRGKTKRYSVNYKRIIEQYEKSAGFRICYWCGEKIEIGERIIFSKEFPSGEVCPSHRLKVIGAVCSNCFKEYTKLMWDSLEMGK